MPLPHSMNTHIGSNAFHFFAAAAAAPCERTFTHIELLVELLYILFFNLYRVIPLLAHLLNKLLSFLLESFKNQTAEPGDILLCDT